MDIQNIVFLVIIVGAGIVRFIASNNKKKAQQQQQQEQQLQQSQLPNQQEGTGTISPKQKSKMQEFLERLELIEEGEIDQRLGMPGTPQGKQTVRQPGTGPQMPPGVQSQRPPGQLGMQPVMQTQMQQQQMQQQQIQRAAQEELKQKQKRQEKIEQLRRQQQQKTDSKIQVSKEVENQGVVRRGSFGINSRRQLVNGIIMSEILGPPRALNKR